MTTSVIRNFLEANFHDHVIINGATTQSPSISVFQGPEGRSGATLYIGGVECNDFKKMPINILVKWSSDTDVAYQKALEIHSFLLGKNNFTFESVDFAYISILDDHPIWVGRDDENVCEYIIRADFYYYS